MKVPVLGDGSMDETWLSQITFLHLSLSYENILQLHHMLKCKAVFTSTVEEVSLNNTTAAFSFSSL
jgi:hypothetical protein